MPMISRQGFIDVSALEYLGNPDRAYVCVRQAMNEYGIWRELGKMPRQMLPENPFVKEAKGRSLG